VFGTKACESCSILGIGALNFFGPKRTGELTVAVSVPTAIVVIILGLFTVPHLVDRKVRGKFLIRLPNQNLQIMGVTIVVSSRDGLALLWLV
jgi:hypothetical protein